MSVQPALAEAAALSEMQMAAFEGEHRERQLIRPFIQLKDKKNKKNLKKGSAKPLCVGRFMSIVLKGRVFIHCPHATGFWGRFKDSGNTRTGTKDEEMT